MIDVNRQNEVRDDGQAFAVPNGLRELESLKELAKSANARIYIGFDKHHSLKED